MKESAWDNKLWHDKMQELPIPGDKDSAWDKMRILLDENMPVSGPVTRFGFIQNSFGRKLISIFGAIIIAGILYYTVAHVYPSFKQKAVKENTHKVNPFNITKPVKPDEAHNSGADNTAANNLNKNTADNKNTNTIPVGTKKLVVGASKDTLKPGGSLRSNIRVIKSTGIVVNTPAGVRGPSIVHRQTIRAGKITSFNKGNNNPYITSSQASQNLHVPQTNTPENSANNRNTINDNPAKSINAAENKQLKVTDSASSTPQSNIAINVPATKDVNSNAANPEKTDKAPPASAHTGINNKLPGKTAHRYAKKHYPATNQVFKLNNSKFELNINGGYNANASAFIGMAAAYYITPKLSLGLAVQILPSNVMAGSYHNSNYTYTLVDRSGNQTTYTADNIVVQSTAKFHNIDVPVMAYYHINKYISVDAGPVIVFPVYMDDLKNTLSPIKNPADTLSAYKTIVSGANNTTISNKVGVNLSGGLRVSISRFYLDANYVHGLSPYTISSSLGSDKVYYHTFQFGIGYYIYRPKPKKH